MYATVAVAADWLAQLALQNQDYEYALGHSRNERFKSVKILSSRIQLDFAIELNWRIIISHWPRYAMPWDNSLKRATLQDAIDSYRMLATKNASYAGLMRVSSQYGNYCLEHSEFEEAVTVFWRDQLKLTVEADMPEEARGIVRFMLCAALARRGLGLLETDAGLARRDLEQGVAYLENAYSELKKNENALLDSSKKQIIEIVELLVEIYTDWKRPDDAGKWQKELENAKTQRGDLPKN